MPPRALVGWYLMVPPALFYEAAHNSQAHFLLWEIRGSYISAIECEKALKKLRQDTRRKEEDDLETAARMDANLDSEATAEYEAVRLARCVSMDDPHLKGKVE